MAQAGLRRAGQARSSLVRAVCRVKDACHYEPTTAHLSTGGAVAEAESGPASQVLLASVARRYYLSGQSKVQISADLGLSRFQVARMLERARATGLVRIEIGAPGSIDLDTSSRLQET